MTEFKRKYPYRVEKFQYRKRYEVTCDVFLHTVVSEFLRKFQYRKRYEVTCDVLGDGLPRGHRRFNTASGMRSHVTKPFQHLTKQMPLVSIPQAV